MASARADKGGRADVVLVALGLARSRGQAQELIAQGNAKVDGEPIKKASQPVAPGQVCDVESDPWVSRGAHKLLGALDDAGLVVAGRVLDAGASTGGFTQVVLSRGADVVYAIDVGHGQLAESIRDDPRVVVREGLNLRDLTLNDVGGEPVDLIVGDVSFISLRMLLAPLFHVLAEDGRALLMIKPQFEVGRERLGAGGVVRSPRDRAKAIKAVIDDAKELGWVPCWEADSQVPGPAGNVEHFVLFTRARESSVAHGRLQA